MRTECTFKWRAKLLLMGMLLFLFILPTKLKSQNQQIVFVDNFKRENYSAATFGIIGNIGSFDKNFLEAKISKLPGVISIKVFYERRCLVVFNEKLDILALRGALLSENLDFDLITISTNDKNLANELKYKKAKYPRYLVNKKPIDPINWIYPDSYPKRINTGNIELDDLKYEDAQQTWIRFYPEEYKTMTGIENMDDFNYTQMKSQTAKYSY